METRNFLLYGGALLVVIALFGFIGVLGPTAQQSIFGETWYFSDTASWIHLIIGAVMLAGIVFTQDMAWRRWLSLVVGVFAAGLGLLSFFLPEVPADLFGANVRMLINNLFHIAFGVWGIWAVAAKTSGITTFKPTGPTVGASRP